MTLEKVRKNIDFIDSKILNLLKERMEQVLMAKRFKSRIEDSQREKELLERIRNNSNGLINAEFIEKVYKEIIKESKSLQMLDHKLIAFHGEHGAYGEVAAKKWNGDLVPVPCSTFADIFEGVKSNLYDFGIVPVENTLGGVLSQVNQLLINSDLHVVGAIELPINHCLLVRPGTDHREIRVVYSQAQVLSQCRKFITRNKLEPVQFYDPAGAAKMLAETAPKASAVIASKLSAELYNLEIFKEDVDDFDSNMTRFLVLSSEENGSDGDKCSIIFSTEHKAGTLFSVLETFANKKINLTRIESIPDEKGSYVFFLDFIGSKKDKDVTGALKEVETITSTFKMLGCYQEIKVA